MDDDALDRCFRQGGSVLCLSLGAAARAAGDYAQARTFDSMAGRDWDEELKKATGDKKTKARIVVPGCECGGGVFARCSPI